MIARFSHGVRFSARDLLPEAESSFGILWMLMSGCYAVARNKRVRRLDRPNELPVLEFGQFSFEALEERLTALRELNRQGFDRSVDKRDSQPIGRLRLTLACSCERLLTATALTSRHCAFERAFEGVKQNPDSTQTEVQFLGERRVPFTDLDQSNRSKSIDSEILSAREYQICPTWARRVFADGHDDLIRVRLLALDFVRVHVQSLRNGADSYRPANLRFRLTVKNIPLDTTWTPVPLPSPSEVASDDDLRLHMVADRVLHEACEKARAEKQWTETTQARIVSEALSEIHRESDRDLYPQFRSLIDYSELGGTKDSLLFCSELQSIRQRIWDAPLCARFWRDRFKKFLQEQEYDETKFIRGAARLTTEELDRLKAAQLDEWTIASQESTTDTLIRVLKVTERDIAVRVAGLDSDVHPKPRISIEQIPTIIRPYLKMGLVLAARVNLGAPVETCLKFRDIQLPLKQTIPLESSGTSGEQPPAI